MNAFNPSINPEHKNIYYTNNIAIRYMTLTNEYYE